MEEMSPPNLCPPKADDDPSPSQAEGTFPSHLLARHRGAPPDPGEPGGGPAELAESSACHFLALINAVLSSP